MAPETPKTPILQRQAFWIIAGVTHAWAAAGFIHIGEMGACVVAACLALACIPGVVATAG